MRKPWRGRIEVAVYKDTQIEDYKNHPMIEALPEILEVVEAARKIKVLKKFNPEERKLSASKRKHCVERLSTYIIPLNKHLEVEEKLSIFIRKGYLSRNIANADHIRRLRNVMMQFDQPVIAELEREKYQIPAPTSSGLGIIGISGAGKSSGITRILNIYPQIILHPDYEEKQLVWLKIDCPVTGTIKQLCLNFIMEISELMGGVNYEEYVDYKTDQLIPIMSSLALQHHLGVLVIDEIQYLHEVKSGGAALMLNFFNTLINTIGVPIVLIGTPKARHLFTKEFRNIKRITDQGSVDWDRLKEGSNDWKTLLTYIWDHQWTLQQADLSPEIEGALYYESQGIPDLVIKIFKESQKRVIGNTELITSSVIHSVAQDQFQLLQPALNALRSGKKSEMLKYLDIFMKFEPDMPITQEDKKLYSKEYGIQLEDVLHEKIQNDSIEEVIHWLMDADISEDVAKRIALDTQDEDILKWKKDAFEMAIKARSEEISHDQKTGQHKENSKKKKHDPTLRSRQTGMLTVLNPSSKEKNMSLYALMKKNGYVQNVHKRLGLE
ncbi:ATP-binding protein [Brevibacillus brevis]|uniref:ATP-binding protein n=1 Tax=Brevibacillus brevis TaxID=1393 RepID=UPI0025A5693E|nr:ATP-binding protein [Brevibacillus brevis]WJQ84464.1 ATP-binding protein [Brevibacillus brevis]